MTFCLVVDVYMFYVANSFVSDHLSNESPLPPKIYVITCYPSPDGAIFIHLGLALHVFSPRPASDLQQLAQAATFPAIRFLPLDRSFAVSLPHPAPLQVNLSDCSLSLKFTSFQSLQWQSFGEYQGCMFMVAQPPLLLGWRKSPNKKTLSSMLTSRTTTWRTVHPSKSLLIPNGRCPSPALMRSAPRWSRRTTRPSASLTQRMCMLQPLVWVDNLFVLRLVSHSQSLWLDRVFECSAHCTMCTCDSRICFRPNKLGLIIKYQISIAIEHMLIPTCSVERKKENIFVRLKLNYSPVVATGQ